MIATITASLETGVEFQTEIETVLFTFRPVKRCPEKNRDKYGASGQCLGVCIDWQNRRGANYRFCPKSEHTQSGLTDYFWDAIKRETQFELKRQADRDNAQAKQRRIEAALELLGACLNIDRMAPGDRPYLQGVKAKIARAKSQL